MKPTKIFCDYYFRLIVKIVQLQIAIIVFYNNYSAASIYWRGEENIQYKYSLESHVLNIIHLK